jgi:hypothetical protein
MLAGYKYSTSLVRTHKALRLESQRKTWDVQQRHRTGSVFLQGHHDPSVIRVLE